MTVLSTPRYDLYQNECKEAIHTFMMDPVRLEATIHMMCGTGKSKVEIDILQKETKHLSILLVPSLALKDQFQESYFSQLEEEFDIIYVNSDYGGITNLKTLEQLLRKNVHKKTIIVCLYQSFHTLNKVLFGKEKFMVDFLIADESHYLDNSKEGKKILKQMKYYQHIKKLYFSATPSDSQKEHVIFKYGYLDGVQDNVLQPFEIYLQYDVLDSTIREVDRDGNCFFHCLAYFLNKSHTEIRKECIDFYLEKSDSELEDFGVERHKIHDLYQDGVWDTDEFDPLPKIASELYQRTVTVFKEDEMVNETYEIPNGEDHIHLRLKESHYDVMEYKKQSEKETVLEYFRFMVRNSLLTGNNKIMCFHNGVDESNVVSRIPVDTMKKYKKDFQAIMDEMSSNTKKVRWGGLSSNQKKKDRNRLLEQFKTHDDPDCLFILSSCMTLREGVDTSDANSLMWVDPKTNYRMVIQNLGRIVRKGNKIQNGSVILPIKINRYIYEQCSTEEETSNLLRHEMNDKNGNFNPIIYFLDSLRINDPDIAIQLESYPPPRNTGRSPRFLSNPSLNDDELHSDSGSMVDDELHSDSSSMVDDELQSDSSYQPSEESEFEDEKDSVDGFRDKTHITKTMPKKRPWKIRIHFPEVYNIHLGKNFPQSLCATLEHSVNSSKNTSQEKVDMLVDFANKNERHPTYGESIDGFKIGQFWRDMKGGQCTHFLPQCLQRSTWLKNDYERYLKEKQDAKTPQEKVDALVDFANKNEKAPKQGESIDGFKIDKFWTSMKGGQCAHLLPQCLERSTWLKDDYERYLKGKEDAKTPQEKVDILVDFANKNARHPTYGESIDGVKIGKFWTNMKGGTNANLLPQCLERSTWLKKDYDKYCERQKKKGKSIKKVLVKTTRKPRVVRNISLHRKVQESSASGIYNDENPPHLEDKNYINETLANHIPPDGRIIVLDGTKFRTSRKLNQPQRTTIVQFNHEHYNEMIDDETFGDCMVYDHLASYLQQVNEPLGMVYADICGSWKEMQPILEALSEKEFVENAVVACTTCCRDGERKTEEGLDFVSWLIEEMNERLDGKWKLIGERGRMKYGNMCTRMIRKIQ